jgi:hypothetical protein
VSERPFSEQSKDKIERGAPAQWRAQRETFYADIENRLASDVVEVVLAAIAWAPKIAATRRTDRPISRSPENRWYWSERRKIEEELERLQSNPLVRPESNLEVLFYAPAEVDCDHGRRRKVCVHIREKLELRKHLQETRQSLLGMRAAGPVLRTLQRRIDELDTDIQKLDVRVNPVSADLRGFCLRADPPAFPSSQEEEDRRPVPGKPGAPPDDVQNYLLETVGAVLADAGHTRQDACDVVANALIYCAPDGAERSADRPPEDAVDDLRDSLERQWRVLRAK